MCAVIRLYEKWIRDRCALGPFAWACDLRHAFICCCFTRSVFNLQFILNAAHYGQHIGIITLSIDEIDKMQSFLFHFEDIIYRYGICVPKFNHKKSETIL